MFPYSQSDPLADLRAVVQTLEQALAKLRAENDALRARIAELEAQQRPPRPDPEPPVAETSRKPRQTSSSKPRQKRAQGYARRRQAATQRIEHALEQCRHCGCTMRGGSVKRTRQVLHIPLVPVQVIEHVFIERACPQCGRRQTPKPQEVLEEGVGRHRLSATTMALIATLRQVGRLPIGTIRWYLQTFHQLSLSEGELVEVLHSVASLGQATVKQLQQTLRASPVVHGDETEWHENGHSGYFWSFSTPTIRYFVHRASRSGELVNETLGADFEGVLVSDFYVGYNRMLGAHQRCWVHLLRDVHELQEQWPDEQGLRRWAGELKALYQEGQTLAQAEAPPKERRAQQHRLEGRLQALCEPYLTPEHRQHVLCQRLLHYLPEMFQYVADPRVPADNNAAERAIRPLAVARKISGGTRSPQGSKTRAALATLFGTWLVRQLNPFIACRNLLTSP